jgi:hypothetical protein
MRLDSSKNKAEESKTAIFPEVFYDRQPGKAPLARLAMRDLDEPMHIPRNTPRIR